MSVCDAIMSLLKDHDRGNPILAGKIIEAIPAIGTDVKLRQYVNAMRRQGAGICATSEGYFWSDRPEDLYETIRSLEGRIQGIVNAIEGMRKTADQIIRLQHKAEQEPVHQPRIVTIPFEFD